jgi:hypothetical protein
MTFTNKNRPVALIAGASLVLLTACGGGGGNGGSGGSGAVAPLFVEPLELPDGVFALQDGAIVTKSLTPSTNAVNTNTGSIDGSQFEIGGLTGEITQVGSNATLTGGGGVTLTSDGTEFVGLFDASPQGGARSIGVIGSATPTQSLPSGSLLYTGDTRVTIVDGADIYDLSGDLTIEAQLAGSSPSIVTTFDNLDGTRTDTVSAAVNVTDVAEITISGSTFDGAAFSNGAASLASDNIGALSSGATASLEGGFFGPSAEEVGGVGVITDTSDISFDFTGRR